MSELSEIMEKISKIEKDNKAYLYNRTKLEKEGPDMVKKLKEVCDWIESFDPNVNIKVTKTNRTGNFIRDECYELMKNGTHITREFLEQRYPEHNNHSYLLSTIKDMPNVQSAKDGVKIRLYI